MRPAHWKAHLLPLLLLTLHLVSVCLADGCTFDDDVTKKDDVTIAVAKAQKTDQNWEPLRIVASTKDLQTPSKYCTKDRSIIELRSQSAGSECKDFFAIFTEQQKTIATGIIEKSIALHTDRLLVQRATGPLVIPSLSTHTVCKYLNVPEEHHTKGVANADMVLYVASFPDSGNDNSEFSGMTCAKIAGGRPIAGVLFIGSGITEISRHTVRLTAHHIAHALGFSYNEMKSRNMIMEKTVGDKTTSIALVKSERAKQMTKAHYGCPQLEGMELEDGKKNNEKLSHWKRRNAKDELMAVPMLGTGTSFMGFYTSLTLAAFEDLGFYKANFEMAEHMEYGNNKGCEFMTGNCMKDGKTKWPNMLCAAPESQGSTLGCTTDRLGFGTCAPQKKTVPPSRLSQVHYFALAQQGASELSSTDSCPAVEQDISLLCTNTAATEQMPGSLFGKSSMCLDGDDLKFKKSSEVTVSVSAVCAEILCEGGSFKVKYHGATDKWHECPEGKSLTLSSIPNSFESGKIKCPKYKEVCTVAPDGRSLVPKKVIHKPIETSTTTSTSAPQDATESQKPTVPPNDSNSGKKSKDSSPVPFGLIYSVAFIMLSFAGYLIA